MGYCVLSAYYAPRTLLGILNTHHLIPLSKQSYGRKRVLILTMRKLRLKGVK